MVLSCHPEQTWHSEQVAASSAIPLAAVKASLAHLHRHELLELVPGDHPVYRLGPRAELPLLTLIREAHRRDRIAVVNAFYACNLESLRSFASAFRIRRPS